MELSPLESPSPIESKQPSPAATAEVSKLGNQLVTKFRVLMRVSQIYDSKNVTLQQFLQEFLQTINALVKREGGFFSLKIIKDELYLNNLRLRYSVEGFASFKYLLTHWKRRLIGEVIFRAPVDEKTLTEFISILVSLEEGRQENASLVRAADRVRVCFNPDAVRFFDSEDGRRFCESSDYRLRVCGAGTGRGVVESTPGVGRPTQRVGQRGA